MSLKDAIVSRCKTEGLLRNEAAYVLATADWETAHTFEPVREAFYLGAKADAYRKKLRYYPWYGRGLVQLTWEENYQKAGKAIGVDLTKNPDAAMDPKNAVAILVLGMKFGWFTGARLSDYFTLKRSEFIGARKIINGRDKAQEIAGLAMKYNAELKAAGYGVDGAKPSTPAEPETPAIEAKNWLSVIIELVVGLFARLWKR